MPARGRALVTREERLAREAKILEHLQQFTPFGELAAIMQKDHGIGPSMTDKLVRGVKKRLGRVGLTFTQKELNAEQLLVFEGMKMAIFDAKLKGDHATAIRGYRELGRILGLYQERLVISGPNGGPVETSNPTLTDTLTKMIAAAKANQAAE